jgi:hypothetical protein
MQFAGGFGDTFAAHTEHVGNELLRQGQLAGRKSVEGE